MTQNDFKSAFIYVFDYKIDSVLKNKIKIRKFQ